MNATPNADACGQPIIRFSATLALQHDSIFSPFRASEFDTAIEWARESGLDGVELVISDYASLPNAAIGELKDRLAARGLGVSTLSTGGAYFREGLSLTSADAGVRELARRRLFAHIDAAQVLGSQVTIGLLRGVGSKENAGEEEIWLSEEMLAIDAYASSRGVGILLEAINRYEVRLLNSLARTVAFIDALGLSSVKVLWDLFHANIEDLEFSAEIARHAAHIGHVHLADNNRAFPGHGKFDFAAILASLADNGYQGFASFECLNAPANDSVIKGARAFVADARAGLRSHRRA